MIWRETRSAGAAHALEVMHAAAEHDRFGRRGGRGVGRPLQRDEGTEERAIAAATGLDAGRNEERVVGERCLGRKKVLSLGVLALFSRRGTQDKVAQVLDSGGASRDVGRSPRRPRGAEQLVPTIFGAQIERVVQRLELAESRQQRLAWPRRHWRSDSARPRSKRLVDPQDARANSKCDVFFQTHTTSGAAPKR